MTVKESSKTYVKNGRTYFCASAPKASIIIDERVTKIIKKEVRKDLKNIQKQINNLQKIVDEMTHKFRLDR